VFDVSVSNSVEEDICQGPKVSGPFHCGTKTEPKPKPKPKTSEMGQWDLGTETIGAQTIVRFVLWFALVSARWTYEKVRTSSVFCFKALLNWEERLGSGDGLNSGLSWRN